MEFFWEPLLRNWIGEGRPVLGYGAVRRLFGDGAIANVFQVVEKRRLRHLAASAFELGVVKQVEAGGELGVQLDLIEAPNSL